MLANSKNIAIFGGNLTNVERLEVHGGGSTAFEKLQRATAHGAFHNSAERFDPPKCHENTRTAVLNRLAEWIMGHADREALIMWLYGAAGAGKSAIAQTIAERCYAVGLVLASFFFSRSDPTRSHAGSLFPTLAYQIARTLPDARNALERIIDRDPLIFTQSLEAQVVALIIEPLQPLIQSGFFDDPETSPRLIIIDGLDECHDPKIQSSILNIITDLLRKHHIPLIFLISSRPEPTISYKLNSSKLSDIRATIPLSDELDSEDDIRRFLEDSFAEIKATHPRKHLIPASWPPEGAVETLIEKSSRQFIYAAVSMKSIASIHHRPTHCLDIILGLRPPRREMPFAELDALYAHILSSATYSDEALSIISYCLLSSVRRSMKYIEWFLGLEEGDAEIFLGDFTALLTSTERGYVRILHASLGDFLLDQSRSGPFYINRPKMHANYANRFCELVSSGSPSIFNYPTTEIWHLDLILDFSHHLPLAGPNTQLLPHIEKCSPSDLLHFLDPSSSPPIKFYRYELPRYLKTIQEWDVPQAANLYQQYLATYYQLLKERMDNIVKPDSMLLWTLIVSGPKMRQLLGGSIPETHKELEYPFSVTHYQVYPAARELFISFIQDPSLSQHHALTGSTYLTSAALCLKLLCDRRRFSFSTPYTSHNTQSSRITPWTWSRLVKTNRHFCIRKRMAKQRLYRVWLLSDDHPFIKVLRKHPFPNLYRKMKKSRDDSKGFRILLDGLPELLRRSDTSSDLVAYRHRAFTNMALKYPRSAKRARKALEDYISRAAEDMTETDGIGLQVGVERLSLSDDE